MWYHITTYIKKGEKTMAYNRPDDGLKAATRYLKKCDTITIRPLKADGERIRSAAESSGMSLTKFIMTAVNEYIDKQSSAAQPAEEKQAKTENE